MISDEELHKFRKLIEAFSDIDNTDYDYSDALFETNNSIKSLCTVLVGEPTATDEQEAELCYVLLLAISSLIIVNASPLIDKVVSRSKHILGKLTPTLAKVRLCTYLYCIESGDRYKDEARRIINSWKGEKMTEEEKQVIKEFKEIAG